MSAKNETQAAADLTDELTAGMTDQNDFSDLGEALTKVGQGKTEVVKKAASKPKKTTTLVFDKSDYAILRNIRLQTMATWPQIVNAALKTQAEFIKGTETLVSKEVSGELVSINSYAGNDEDVRVKMSFACDDEANDAIQQLRIRFTNNSSEIPSISQVIRTVINVRENELIEVLK
jgi:hypothetical protein